jgi:tetratricopeptide (TPR) repeat protein
VKRGGNPALWGAFCLITALASAQPVRVWQDSISLPSYVEGDAVGRPEFAAWKSKEPANYPYPLRTALTSRREDRTWRTLNLENEYLLCRVLPDLGGHLDSCQDKRNGREMFHANPVIKPGLVGLRGAWDAIGIESNFPVGHTRVSTSPVDFGIRADSDGSARALVEQIDRVTGMQWRVEFLLRPGSTVLEQRVLLHNGTPARWPFYWWANAEITLDDPGMRFVLPAHAVSTHANPSEILAWPVNEDSKDGTVVANHKSAGAWFSYGSREPFFAVYKPNSRSGVAHFADPHAVPGKKLWLWGTQRDAWVRSALTDSFFSYVEMQAGVFADQDTFGFLEPEEFRAFTEFWIPIHDLGGVSRATPDAVLNIQRQTAGLVIELSATHDIQGARIHVATEGKSAYETSADLRPSATYRYRLPNPGPGPYTVELADARGAVLLRHTEGSYDAIPSADAPLGKVPAPDWTRLAESDALYLERGKFHELQQRWDFAFSDYTEGLRHYPASIALKKAAGSLYLNLNRIQEAAKLQAEVVQAAPSDDEALYDLGSALAMSGSPDASAMLARVRPDSAFARAASLQLARLAARAGDDAGALAKLRPLIENHSGPVRAGALEVLLLRRSGKITEAKAALSAWREVDPADTMLRLEGTRLGNTDEELWKHLAVDAERVLGLVDEYLSLGMEADALVLLDHAYPPVAAAEIEPGAVPVALSPMIAYYRAFCRSRLGQDAMPDLRQAASGYTRYLFPYRFRSFQVLGNAIKLNPSDALAHFLLARLNLNSLLADNAVAEYRKAIALNPKLPEVHAELARALIEVQHDLPGAYTVLNEGLRLDQGNSDLRELSERAAQALTIVPKPNAVTAPVTSAPATSPPPRAPATVAPAPAPQAPAQRLAPVEVARAALLQAASGNAAEAFGLFNAQAFPAEKQPDEVRRAYIEVQLHKLRSIARAGQCSDALDLLFRLGNEDKGLDFTLYGFDEFMKAPHFQYYVADLEATCHQEKAARKRWTKVSKSSEPISSPEYVFPLLAAWKLNPQEARPKIEAGIEAVRNELAKQSTPELQYAQAMLLHALGKDEDSLRSIQKLTQVTGDSWLAYLATLGAGEILRVQ